MQELKLSKESLLLYAVTDRKWLQIGEHLSDKVEQAIQGGVTIVQLREKHLEYESFLQQAQELKQVTQNYNIPLIINDRVDIALAMDADGVHVGQSDMDVLLVRESLGADKILGVSAQTVEQAIAAEAAGADYLGVGAMFPTNSKEDAVEVTSETLKSICKAVEIPVVAIGGITLNNLNVLKGTGIAGAAVISAVFAEPEICQAARLLKEKCREIFAN